MNVLVRAAAAGCAAFALLAVNANAAVPRVNAAAIDRILNNEAKLPGAASIAVAIVADGKLVYERAAGPADRTTGRLATPTTLYNLASVTKSFTAEAVLLLAHRGKIRLDDKLSVYRPDLGHAAEVSIRQMLQHTSCLPNVGSSKETLAALNEDPSGEKALAIAFKDPLWCKPGRHFVYSNGNYLALGKVVERVSGMPLQSFFEKNLFAPAGVNDAHFGPTPQAAKPYIFSRKRGMVSADDYPFAAEGGAGALFLSARGLAQFDMALMAGRYLPRKEQGEAWKAETFENGTTGKYGMGWFSGTINTEGAFLSTLGDLPVVEHTGSNPGYQTRNAIFPGQNVAIVILANSSSYATFELFERVAAVVMPGAASHAVATGTAEVASDRSMVQEVYAALVAGTLPRERLSARYWSGYTPEFQKDLAKQLADLGGPITFTLVHAETNGDEREVDYKVTTSKDPVQIHLGYDTDGLITQIDLH